MSGGLAMDDTSSIYSKVAGASHYRHVSKLVLNVVGRPAMELYSLDFSTPPPLPTSSVETDTL